MSEEVADISYSELLAAIASGDEQALADFYDATLPHCFGLAYRITRNKHDAEDVVAETYLQVWNEASQFTKERGTPLAWLLIICRSRALDYLRRHNHNATISIDQEVIELKQESESLQDLLESMQRSDDLYRAIATLPNESREILSLLLFKDLSMKEISRIIKIPVGTVKSHIHRAKVILSRKIARHKK